MEVAYILTQKLDTFPIPHHLKDLDKLSKEQIYFAKLEQINKVVREMNSLEIQRVVGYNLDPEAVEKFMIEFGNDVLEML